MAGLSSKIGSVTGFSGVPAERVGATATALAAAAPVVVIAAAGGEQGTDTSGGNGKGGRTTEELPATPTSGHQWTSPQATGHSYRPGFR